jgi:metal-responsive CopG/Arc/MetJ family transcriptional regulator
MKPGKDNLIAIPPALLAEIQAAANEEKRPAEEMLREAIERYLQNRRWQRLFAYGEERARELG